MAIAKTIFTGTTLAEQAAEVYAFLNANKSGYFDSVTQDESGNISCMVGETVALKLGFDGTTKNIIITLANGETVSTYNATTAWGYAYKTDRGLYLHDVHNENQYPFSVYIAKTDTDSTAIVAYMSINSSTNQRALYCADITGGNAIYVPYSINVLYQSIYSAIAATAGSTTLTPLPLTSNTASYAPDLCMMFFSQYPYTPAVITIGTTQYVSNGFLALKE